MLYFYTSGESHGKGIFVHIEGVPAGLVFDAVFVNRELARRQLGYGRGPRMNIERDEVQVLAGVYRGKTTGAPILLAVYNRDWENWKDVMDPLNPKEERPFFAPRPGHADLPALLKYGYKEIRPVIERASARETAGRVAAGAVFKLLLREFGVEVASAVLAIGSIRTQKDFSFEDLLRADEDTVRCPDPEASKLMVEEINKAKEAGDTLGGIFEVRARGVPVGLGSHTQWNVRLDGRIAQAMMSIQAVKGVSVGCGWDCWDSYGSSFHDEIFYRDGKIKRSSNRAGGVEGGITNGEEIVVRCFFKPIPTLRRPLASFDIRTRERVLSGVERSDVCAVPAAAVVGEAMLAFVLAQAMKEKFGGDCLEDMKLSYREYLERLQKF